MKRLLLGVLAACCSTLAYSQATEIVVETYAENIGMTGTTDSDRLQHLPRICQIRIRSGFLDRGIW